MRGFFILVFICMLLNPCPADAFLSKKKANPNSASNPLDIIENSLLKSPNDKTMLTSAFELSMAQQDWDKALIYNNKLLELEPNCEKLLKNSGDLYSIKKKFPSAIKAYKKLVENYPTPNYVMALGSLYLANQDFVQAQAIMEPIYKDCSGNPAIVDLYLKSLLGQEKISQAYWVIKTHHLDKTKEGYIVLGDMAMLDKDYECAKTNYKNALDFDPENLALQSKLANSYRKLGCIITSEQIFKAILAKEPCNIEARLGLGYLEIDKKNFNMARQIFSVLLSENPCYRSAQIAMADSYIANDDKFKALDTLETITPDTQTKLMTAQTYYDIEMRSDSKQMLKGLTTKEAEALKYKIRRDNAITITPNYTFFFQQLAEEFKLDYHKFGLNISKDIDDNKKFFMEYNAIIYTSGRLRGSTDKLNNVVNEFKTGIQARPSEKWEYRADLGVKAFEFGGGMILTDSWIKHYYNDKFNLKAGYKRNNVEQSYLSAVGGPIDGVFTGRACDNKFYIEANRKLPRQFYAYGTGSVGFIYAQNLPTNDYFEAMIGAGRLLYNNPKNPWINTFSADVISYNSSYQYNFLRIYSGTGQLFGGYFSPAYFNATTLNLKVEGNIKKWNLKYGIKAFSGLQTAMTPDATTLAWGFSPYIAYDLNDNVTINLLSSHFSYADITRDQLIINAVIRGFKKHAKSEAK